MMYVNFESHITEKFGIIVENWPLEKFIAPGAIGSRIELQTLYNAWSTGATSFRRLSPAELKEWHSQKFQVQVAAAPAPSSLTPAATSSSAGADDMVTQESAAGTDDMATQESAAGSSTISAGSSSLQQAAASTSEATLTPGQPSPVAATHMGVFAVTSQVLVEKKKRKKRSDAGTKRLRKQQARHYHA